MKNGNQKDAKTIFTAEPSFVAPAMSKINVNIITKPKELHCQVANFDTHHSPSVKMIGADIDLSVHHYSMQIALSKISY